MGDQEDAIDSSAPGDSEPERVWDHDRQPSRAALARRQVGAIKYRVPPLRATEGPRRGYVSAAQTALDDVEAAVSARINQCPARDNGGDQGHQGRTPTDPRDGAGVRSPSEHL